MKYIVEKKAKNCSKKKLRFGEIQYIKCLFWSFFFCSGSTQDAYHLRISHLIYLLNLCFGNEMRKIISIRYCFYRLRIKVYVVFHDPKYSWLVLYQQIPFPICTCIMRYVYGRIRATIQLIEFIHIRQ